MAEQIAATNAESESLAIERATREAERKYYAERVKEGKA